MYSHATFLGIPPFSFFFDLQAALIAAACFGVLLGIGVLQSVNIDNGGVQNTNPGNGRVQNINTGNGRV